MNTTTITRLLQPGQWLPIQAMQREARREGSELTARWDVPQGKDVPEDLKDVSGRLFRLPSGARIAGRMLPEDAQIGFQSAAVPLLFAALPVLAVLAVWMQSLFGGVSLVIPVIALIVVVGMISTAAGTGAAIGASVFGVGLPIFGTAAGPLMQGLQASVVSGIVVGIVLLLFAAVLINSHRLRLAAKGAVAVMALAAVVAFLPPSMHQLFWLFVSCSLTPLYGFWTWKTWALRLATQGIEATLESSGPQANSHIDARRKQLEAAKADSSPVLKVAVAKGVFTTKQDGFAPDAGLPFALSMNDLSTHMVVFGLTGTGKTAGVLRPLAAALIRAGQAGILILDGKASLAAEFVGLKDYLLISPATCSLGLIEGLSPIDVVIAFDSVSKAGVKNESASSAFFNSQAREMLHHGMTFLRALADSEAENHGPDSEERQWRWTLHDAYSILLRAQRGNSATAQVMDAAIAQVRRMSEEVGTEGLLDDTLEYFATTLPGMDEETCANVWATLQTWILPAMRNADILKWARCEHGVDVDHVLKGGVAGVCLPEFTYGVAGKLVQALVKQRLFTGIRRRADRDWRALGEKDVVIICDEAQEVVGEADLKMLPVARSLGCKCVYATQHMEGFITRFGDANAAEAFTANFRSFVCLNSSPLTLKWAQKRLGTTWSLIFKSPTFGVDYRGSWRMIAESPLADASHPAHRYYRRLLQRGAGVMREGRNAVGGLNLHGSSSAKEDASLTLPAMRGGEWVQQHLFQDAESDFLAEPFVAVAEVMRGNVRRRDFVQCEPMFTVPDDLRGVASNATDSAVFTSSKLVAEVEAGEAEAA